MKKTILSEVQGRFLNNNMSQEIDSKEKKCGNGLKFDKINSERETDARPAYKDQEKNKTGYGEIV